MCNVFFALVSTIIYMYTIGYFSSANAAYWKAVNGLFAVRYSYPNPNVIIRRCTSCIRSNTSYYDIAMLHVNNVNIIDK